MKHDIKLKFLGKIELYKLMKAIDSEKKNLNKNEGLSGRGNCEEFNIECKALYIFILVSNIELDTIL